jgi:hypothetical protein
VQIKTAEAIKETLGADGRFDGMSFARLAGTVHDVTRTWDIRTDHLSPTSKAPKARWFILDSLRCDGSVLGADGPCDRWRPLPWHESWVELSRVSASVTPRPLQPQWSRP